MGVPVDVSWVGVWILMFFGNASPDFILPLLAGCAVMTGLGHVLDLLRAKRALLLSIWVVGAIGTYALMMSNFESVERAISKNGSIFAYVVASSQLGLYAAVLLGLLASAVMAWWRMLQQDLARPAPGSATEP